jgi:hypothetical protein
MAFLLSYFFSVVQVSLRLIVLRFQNQLLMQFIKNNQHQLKISHKPKTTRASSAKSTFSLLMSL